MIRRLTLALTLCTLTLGSGAFADEPPPSPTGAPAPAAVQPAPAAAQPATTAAPPTPAATTPAPDWRDLDQIRRRRGVAIGGMVTMGAGAALTIGGVAVAVSSDAWSDAYGGAAIVVLGMGVFVIGEVIAGAAGGAAELHPLVGGPVPVPAILSLSGIGLSLVGLTLTGTNPGSGVGSAFFWTGALSTSIGTGLAIGNSTRALRRYAPGPQFGIAPLLAPNTAGTTRGVSLRVAW